MYRNCNKLKKQIVAFNYVLNGDSRWICIILLDKKCKTMFLRRSFGIDIRFWWVFENWYELPFVWSIILVNELIMSLWLQHPLFCYATIIQNGCKVQVMFPLYGKLRGYKICFLFFLGLFITLLHKGLRKPY